MLLREPLIGGDRLLIDARGIVVPPHPQIDVRAHVHQMSDAFSQVLEPIGRGHSQIGPHLLHRVNQVVVRPGMARVAPQYRLD